LNGERQVGDQDGRGPRERVAHHVDVFEERIPVGRRARFQRRQRHGQDFVEKRTPHRHVDAQRRTLHHAAAHLTQHEVEEQHHAHADQQPAERADAGVEDHAVVDLHGEDRHRQGQQVDEQRDHADLAVHRLQRLEDRLQPSIRIFVRHTSSHSRLAPGQNHARSNRYYAYQTSNQWS